MRQTPSQFKNLEIRKMRMRMLKMAGKDRLGKASMVFGRKGQGWRFCITTDFKYK